MSTRERQKHDLTPQDLRRIALTPCFRGGIKFGIDPFHLVATKPNFNKLSSPSDLHSSRFRSRSQKNERDVLWEEEKKKEVWKVDWIDLFIRKACPFVGPPTASHKYGASYGQLRAINRDFISKLAAPFLPRRDCVIPNCSFDPMQFEIRGDSQGRSCNASICRAFSSNYHRPSIFILIFCYLIYVYSVSFWFFTLGVALGRRRCQRLLPATSNSSIRIKSGTSTTRTCRG